VPRLRPSLGALLAAVATVVAMVCLPAQAFALPSGTNITVTSAGPDGTGNPYDLTVVASDANGQQLTTMTAHVFSGTTPVVDVPMSFQSGVTATPFVQTWAATTPISVSALPPGTYTVTVDAADTTESDPGLKAPGSFAFSYTTTVAVTASPPTVTAGSQSVTFNGKVTGQATVNGMAPSGPAVGLANVPVGLSISGGSPTSVGPTASNGVFSDTITGILASADYNFTVAGTSTYSNANDDVQVNAQQATTVISVTPSSTSVSEGSPGVTFSGTVTVTPQGTTTAAGIGSGVPVNVSINGSPAGQVITNDAGGDFTYPAAPISATTTYTFAVAPKPLYSAASTPPVTIQAIQAPSTISVTAAPNPVTYGSQTVNFTGRVTALPLGGTTAVPVPNAPVYLDGGSTSIATTDANGNFTYPVSGVTQATTYTFSVSSTNLYSAPAPDAVMVTATTGSTNITATASPPFVNLGSSTVTFSGVVTVGPSALPVPSGTQVYVSIGGAPPTAAGLTNASGDFTYVATAVTKTTTFVFSVSAGTLYTTATYQVSVNLDQLTTNLTVTPSQTSVTEGSQAITFTGTVAGIPPGSTTSQPIAGVPVDLNGLTATQVATTDSQGKFIYKVSGISDTAQFNFSVAQTPTYTEATWNVPIGVVPAMTRFTGVHVVQAHLKYGEKATLTGTVQYRNGTTWTALTGAAVHLFEGKTSLGSVRAGKGGSFTATLPTTHGPAWRATLSSAILLQQASAIGNLTISVPMRVKSFAASLSVLGIIKAAGCLQVTVPVRYGPETKIEIQYASRPHGPWTELGRLQLHSVAGAPALCRDANESYFGGSIRAKLANAYYRAYFAGTFTFQLTASSVIHAWRYQTRITDYTVSPRAISTGGKVRISGRLWWHGKSWKPYGKHNVDIVYNEKGTSYWARLGKPVTTSARGYFSAAAQGGSGKFVAIIYAVYPGSKTDLAVQSNGIDVKINESTTSSPAPPAPTPRIGRLPVISLPTYRGLPMLARDAVDIAATEIRALAFWPR
jgi:hypothetical protein